MLFEQSVDWLLNIVVAASDCICSYRLNFSYLLQFLFS